MFHLLSKVPEEMRNKNELLNEFYKKYEETDLKKVEVMKMDWEYNRSKIIPESIMKSKTLNRISIHIFLKRFNFQKLVIKILIKIANR